MVHRKRSLLFLSAILISASMVLALTQLLFPDFQAVEPIDRAPVGNASFEDISNDMGLRYAAVKDGGDKSGVYISDIDQEGFREVLLVGGRQPALYANNQGDLKLSRKFELGGKQVKFAHFFDYNDDGLEDLVFLVRGGKPVFYKNFNGSFTKDESLVDRKISEPVAATSADFNGDGCQDLFVAQFGDLSVQEFINFYAVKSARQKGDSWFPRLENGWPNYLFSGSCGGEFEDVTESSGISGKMWTQAVSAVDLNADNKPDIHVANDFGHDVIYLNQEEGFRKKKLGEASDRHGMSSEIADFNNDLRPDIYVSNIYREKIPQDSDCYLRSGGHCFFGKKSFPHPIVRNFDGNNLFINQGETRGGVSFSDRAEDLGARKGGWGWATSTADFNNDGYLDIVQANSIFENKLDTEYSFSNQRTMFWEGNSNGFKAANSSKLGFYRDSEMSLARLDINRDGCMDLITATSNSQLLFGYGTIQQFRVYNNTGCNAGQFIQVDLRGENVKGTELILNTTSRAIYRVRNARSNYRSQNTRLVHFGLKEDEEPQKLKIKWPDGNQKLVDNLSRGSKYVFRN